MKRILPLVLTVFLLITLAVPVFAATGASIMSIDAILSDDGTCQVTVTTTLRVDQTSTDILFPIPGNARGISVNGGTAITRKSNGLTYIDLSRLLKGVVGDFSIILRYSLPGTVAYNELERPQLTLPLLSGFEFPINRLDFTVTLPEQLQYAPVFSSGYHQQTIEESLTYAAAGNRISGTIDKELKDHETLTMTLRHGYAPVEQYQPMGQGPWTDVYALSATIYFCLTGKKPPHALERLCEDKLVTPIRAGADLTHKQEQVLLYGMGVRPRRRFQSVEAMAKELYKA